ncbi:MAG: BamA/TamA family outer membrane protein, partial [Acidobacteriota bacterium]|nr:BamA/TamA family outer membrane protein [Acidobacteriota bacterium]
GRIDELKLPNALNSAQEVGLLFDRVTLPYASVTEFDQLPIPFRCVGTDMVSGESVPLSSGSLSRSLRATMSIPGVFPPVEVDGKILSDGGLVNNIPTNVVKAMGADIILVINIETQLGGRESLESLPGVLAQTINIATADNSRRSLRQADFIIAPDLGSYSTSDFEKSREIIDLGITGAREKVSLLKGLSLSEADWTEHLAERERRKLPARTPVPDFVAVEGESKEATKTIEEKLADKYTGRPLGESKLDELNRDLSELVGTGRFDSLNYGLKDRQGETGLVINSNHIGDQPSNPTRLEIGFDVNSVESDGTNFNFLTRLTLFDIGRYGAEWRNDLRLGSTTYIASEYYRPLGETSFFVAPRASYERRRIDVFQRDTRLAEYVGQNIQAGVDLGYNVNTRSEIRAGITVGYEDISRRIGDPLLPDIKGRFAKVGLEWKYDGLDKAQVPTKGVLTHSSIDRFFDSPGATGGFTQAETRLNAFSPVKEKDIIFAFGGAGTTFGKTAPQFQQFVLGGPFRVGGYGNDEFRASNYIHAGAGLLHNPDFFPSFLGGKAYIGGWYEGGSAFEQFSRANYRQSLSGGAIFETPLGPVFVGTSINENGRGRLYFSFGRFVR